MAATKKELGDLHSKFTKFLADELEMYIQEGIAMAAADKTVVMTFLKNNGITAESTDEELAQMRDNFMQLKEQRKEAALSILKDAREAMAEQEVVSDTPKEGVHKRVQSLLS